eukprot:1160185-Pelagomonas_calceolata.AAC.8
MQHEHANQAYCRGSSLRKNANITSEPVPSSSPTHLPGQSLPHQSPQTQSWMVNKAAMNSRWAALKRSV